MDFRSTRIISWKKSVWEHNLENCKKELMEMLKKKCYRSGWHSKSKNSFQNIFLNKTTMKGMGSIRNQVKYVVPQNRRFNL